MRRASRGCFLSFAQAWVVRLLGDDVVRTILQRACVCIHLFLLLLFCLCAALSSDAWNECDVESRTAAYIFIYIVFFKRTPE